MLLKERTHFI